MFRRVAEEIIKNELQEKNRKIILLLGQRRTGKTVLLNKLASDFPHHAYFDLESLPNQMLFPPSLEHLESLFRRISKENLKEPLLLLLDEVQNLKDGGTIFKLIYDHFPDVSLVASGSSSFLLLENIGDSLYGRKQVVELFPLTIAEIFDQSFAETSQNLLKFNYRNPILGKSFSSQVKDLFIYGSLPEVATAQTWQKKQSFLGDYVSSFLYKDIFVYEGIRHPEIFKKLLFLLSLQVGNLVNPNELAQTLGISRNTVLEYILIYEKFYLLFRLPPFAINERDEVHTKFKIYFYDLGLRNAIIENYIPFDQRTDNGALFENFIIKSIIINAKYFAPNLRFFFWRNHNGIEVDLVIKDINSGRIYPLEIKLHKAKHPSNAFIRKYAKLIESEFAVDFKNTLSFVI